MVKSQGSIYPVVIKAGAGQVALSHASGRHFNLLNAPGPVLVKFDGLPYSLMRPGQKLSWDAPEFFERIEFQSPNKTRIDLEFWAGFVAFSDNRLDQIEAPTVPVAWPGTQIEPESAVVLTGNPTEDLYRRKCFTISNLDHNVELELCDKDGTPWGIVRPGETITHAISGYVAIKNRQAAAVAVRIGETWWSL